MASTTLVTFLFQAPRPVASVELLGSWDNFSKAYPMQRDRSSGSLDWRGCHSFTGIICDGDDLEGNVVKRDGGLKMGGTYWYYYRLDDDSECCNHSEPYTTSCPLLPGQHVNILEVPIQYTPSHSITLGSQSSLEEQAFTLDPADKFVAPQPPNPQKPKRFRIKSLRPQSPTKPNAALPKLKELIQASPFSPQVASSRSLRTKAQNFKPQTSHPASSKVWDSALDLRRTLCRSADAQVKAWSPYLSRPVTSYSSNSMHPTSASSLEHDFFDYSTLEEPQNSSVSQTPSIHKLASGAPTSDDLDAIVDPVSEDGFSEAHLQLTTDFDKTLGPGAFSKYTDSQSRPLTLDYPEPDHPTGFTSFSSSNRTSGAFSFLESLTGYTNSPEHNLSQPITPSASEFGEFVLEAFRFDDSTGEEPYPADTNRQRSGFSGYNLPEAEHASAITLRAGPSTRPKRPSLNSAFASPSAENKDRIEKWDDGSEHNQRSALQDLVEEMGYLSSLIA